MKNRKGFTLAELLIVVAIIAVLVAVAIPVFSTQLEKSREAVDIANIRAAYSVAMSEINDGTFVSTSDHELSENSTDVRAKTYYVPLKQTKSNWETAPTWPFKIRGEDGLYPGIEAINAGFNCIGLEISETGTVHTITFTTVQNVKYCIP